MITTTTPTLYTLSVEVIKRFHSRKRSYTIRDTESLFTSDWIKTQPAQSLFLYQKNLTKEEVLKERKDIETKLMMRKILYRIDVHAPTYNIPYYPDAFIQKRREELTT